MNSPASDRRRFLKQAALLPLATLAASPARADLPGRPRPGSGRLKLSLNAFSFNGVLLDGLAGKPGGKSLFDVLDFCARQDFEALDPTGYYFPGYPDVPPRTYIRKFKRQAHRLGVAISGTGIRNDFAQPDAEKRAADVARAKAWIEIAAELSAPVLRVFAGAVPKGYESKWDEVAGWMIDAIRECVTHGEKHGVIVGVQNHGDMLKSAAECLKVIQAIESDWCGLIVDTGNMLTADPYADLAQVVPHVVNWQVKESIYNNDRSRPADLSRLFRIIRGGGYRGYVPIETLAVTGVPYDPFTVVPAFTEQVKAAMAAAK
ncbi:MAG TPA: sugar phosphate isomerase/epimerase family protein [Lacunisphaera sp.]|nr:sugar phosphate isomerase/epimerase family protein [Lacunisphaera sp.]